MKSFILTIISILVFILSVVHLNNTLENDLKMYRAESGCVSKYIIDGIERNNIVTNNGSCYVKINKEEMK